MPIEPAKTARSMGCNLDTKLGVHPRTPTMSCWAHNWAWGAYRALVEEKLNGVMVSVSGQLDLHYVPFEELVDPETLVTKVRFIDLDSDFHRLARFLETCVDN